MSAGPPPPAAAGAPSVSPDAAPVVAPAGAPTSAASPPDPSPPLKSVEVAPAQRPASFGRTAQAVFWSFFGVRKRRDYESDAATLNPVHLIVAGVIGAGLFVTLLLVLVNLVTRHR